MSSDVRSDQPTIPPLPKTLSHILVASDLSGRSDRALARAHQLAAAHGASLTLLHIADEDLPERTQSTVIAAAEEELQHTLATLPDRDKVRTRIQTKLGKDYRDILQTADQEGADLLVLGVHRNEDNSRPITGTTMERILRQGRMPVLVVSKPVRQDYQQVMVAVDFSAYSRVAIRCATAVAPAAHKHFVHAFHVPFEGFISDRSARKQVEKAHQDQLAEMITQEMAGLVDATLGHEAGGLAPEMIVRRGDVIGVLRSEAERITPDLMVLGTHGRVGLAHAMLGSVAENMLNQPLCDTLAVKAW